MRRRWILFPLLVLLPTPLAAQRPDAGAEGPGADTVSVDPGAPADTAAVAGEEPDAGRDLLPGVLGEYADIGMVVTGRGELGGAWTRFRPCDATALLTCDPGIIPQITPDFQFGVRVGGTISDRIHVNVDYDQRREFDAANNINVYYQGLEGEFLQRVEVGDVSITLPSSRYLTQGIPAGNFGFKAVGQVGALSLEALWAQQRGEVTTRTFRLGGAGGPEGLVQDATIVLEDADYVQGQFFFLIDPDSLSGAPHIDILSLRAADAPAHLRPAQGGVIQVFRNDQVTSLDPQQMAQLGYFHADAVPPGGGPPHSRQFRRLTQGEDYLVHPSGLWIVLRSPLRPDEALAVAFETETGDVVGTLNPEQAPVTPTLRLIRGPLSTHEPGRPTWRFEMRQVYRLDSSDGVEPGSVELDISLGPLALGRTFKEGADGPVTYLQLFGLDEEAPFDRIDGLRLYQPARSDFGDVDRTARIGGTYIVFPTLRPFAEPPPVPSARLTAEEALELLGPEANPVIYDDPNPTRRAGGSRFRLTARYRVHTEGFVSTFALGAFGIRDGSERITIDGRRLERGRDYDIDYDIGLVTLLDPQGLFAANPDAEIRADWEQKALFEIAPTSIFGLNARYDLGERGQFDFMGLYQGERSIMTRPQLGLEPSSILMSGANGRFELGAGWLDRAVRAIPGLRVGGESAMRLSGELALSMPNPNTRGETYLDDFESADEFTLGMERHFWRLGSRPESVEGAEGVFPFVVDVETAAPLVWQHDFLLGDAILGSRMPEDIDRQINTVGAPRREQVLWMTFGDPESPPPAERLWRSVTTVLSTTGRDLSRAEFLELYVSSDDDAALALVLDIGSVSEDAFYFDELGATTGTYPGGRAWGLGILDEEARVAQGEIWGHALDSLGLWNQACRALPNIQQTYPLGDPRANCTRGNGRPDTEDLNGNGVLDPEGAYFRYVVPLDALSPYMVRDRDGTGTEFRLYRIPLRGSGAIPVNGAAESTWRYVQHLRITITGAPATATVLGIARMRIVGSRWTKREEHGILVGPTGPDPGLAVGTRFQVGPVSRVTEGSAYASPPGVRDELQDPNSRFGAIGIEINEKGLKLVYEGLEGDHRAEVYYRYPQQPRNLMNYRQLRLWALPRAGDWGPAGSQYLLVKLGTDERNYYLFRTPLRPAVTRDRVAPEDWLPELVIDFDRWFDLKARAMELQIERPGEPVVVWSADSAYAVVMEDQFRAPNLAAVRELSFAVYNAGPTFADGEVWIDDLRLLGAVTDAGLAGQVSLDLTAGDFATASVTYASQSGLFRERDQDASYLGRGELRVGATAQLGSFAPESWGLDVPVTVSHSRSSDDPIFLQGSDVDAARLPGLRSTGGGTTRVGLSIRRRRPTDVPILGALIDGTALRLGYNARRSSTMTYEVDARGVDGTLSFGRQLDAREFPLVPRFVADLLRAILPAKIEESDGFERLTSARLRWSPESVSLAATYHDEEQLTRRYDRIISGPADASAEARSAPREGLESSARLALRPLASLQAEVGVASSRDLLPPERASEQVRQREAIRNARDRFAGMEVGWETNRSVTTSLGYRPQVASWLQPAVTYTARFRTDRNPGFFELEPGAGPADSVAVLQRNFQATRQFTRTLGFVPQAFAVALLGPPSVAASPVERWLQRLADATGRVDLSWTASLTSRFDRETAAPGWRYQLGLGGRDAFRFVDRDTAVAVVATDRFTARTAFRLPGSTQLDVAYSDANSEAFDLRGGARTQADRSWPELGLTLTQVPIPGGLRRVIQRATVRTGYVRTRRESTFTGGGEARSSERNIPVGVSMAFASGISAAYNASFREGFRRDPTGRVESDYATQSVSLSGSFDPPDFLGSFLANPITITGRFDSARRVECRTGFLAGSGDCVRVVDDRSRNADLSVDTLVEDLIVGFRLSYWSRASDVGLRNGSSSFEIGVYASFNFTAGVLPGGF